MKYLVYQLFLALLLCGCATDIPRSEQIGLGSRHFQWIANQDKSYVLTEKYSYVFKSGGILGDWTHTLFQGEYIAVGRDLFGTFYYNSESKGVLRSSNLGIKERGGFYVPDMKGGRWGIWIIPIETSFVVPVSGSIVSINSTPRHNSVHYCVNIPSEDEALFQSFLVEVKANKSVEKTPASAAH